MQSAVGPGGKQSVYLGKWAGERAVVGTCSMARSDQNGEFLDRFLFTFWFTLSSGTTTIGQLGIGVPSKQSVYIGKWAVERPADGGSGPAGKQSVYVGKWATGGGAADGGPAGKQSVYIRKLGAERPATGGAAFIPAVGQQSMYVGKESEGQAAGACLPAPAGQQSTYIGKK